MSTNRTVEIWLYFVCFMVFTMAVIGAITRLTESGLSIVVWAPITGALPPLNEAQWQEAFRQYQQIPEYSQQHYWMELDDFKRIYFWEWLHRLWGRLIGVAFALPLLWFWIRKQIPAGYGRTFIALLALGGLQGAIGWWMVSSGLTERTDVSHYRLAVHLGLALVIFSLLWWTALDLGRRSPLYPPASGGKETAKPFQGGRGILLHGWGALAFLALTILWGAFVAGLDAGRIYNTWPLMNGTFLPPEQFEISSIVEKQGWVQFVHRWLAIVTAAAILAFALRLRAYALAVMVVVQVVLGITTLLTQVWIPLGALHQAGAIILLALLLRELQRREAPPPP